MTEVAEQLDRVGDALQRAWRQDHLRHQRHRLSRGPRRLAVVLALVAVLVGGGAAIAAGVLLKTAADEEQGMIRGHQLFAGSAPSCKPLSATSFRCTLDRPPTGMTFYAEDPKGSTVYDGKRYTPVFDKFLGIKRATVDSTRHVDGGCISISANGRTWNCFLGQSAVDHEIIGPALIGTYTPEPPTG